MAVGKALYKLNLENIFGVTPEDDALRAKIEQRALDMIRERTQKDGTDINGKPFPKYSPEYIASLAFKAGGKTNSVDLTLSGDMLNLMDVVDRDGGTSFIGWDDELQNAKAWNHTRGETVPPRNFLGLTTKQVSQLRAEYRDEVNKPAELSDDDKDALSLIELIRSRDVDDNDED